jgi:6-phosphofructokinase
VLATRLGIAAVEAAHQAQWGSMTALHGTEIKLVRLTDAVAQLRVVPVAEYERYGVLFG